MQKYQYKPLPPGCSEIRLVRLQPEVPGSNTPIEIEILHAESSSRPKYRALSYAWGSDQKTDSVSVLAPRERLRVFSRRQKLGELQITSNLAVALSHLRRPMKHKLIWIDAICINQEDLDERSAEVLEMGSIFRNAQEVIVWLGSPSRNSELALQTLKRLGDNVEHRPQAGLLGYSTRIGYNNKALISQTESWLAIKDLITRDWFSRLWVFQEIALARKARIFVGEYSLRWEIAVLGLHWILVMGPKLDRLIETLEINEEFMNSIVPLMDAGCKQRAHYVLDVLDTTESFRCRDPRDRLYAIRSLVLPEQMEVIIPNYSQSFEEVYTNFAKKYLFKLERADILAQCELSESCSIDLPSWVPDWSRGKMSSRLFGYSPYSGWSRAVPTLLEGDGLGVQGVLVTSLTKVTPPAGSLTTDAEIRQTCHSWRNVVSGSASLESNLSFDQAFFVENIVAGAISELSPSIRQNLPSVADIESFLSDGSDKFGSRSSRIRQAIQGRCLFQTTSGLFGLGPQLATAGDRVAVILGCNFPLILRPVMSSERTYFRIVGICYIAGIMKSETLLGPLPSGWSAKYELVDNFEAMVFTNRDIRTQQDPRMPLPPGWRYVYGSKKTNQRREAKRLKHMKWQLFQNTETGKVTKFDPRLTPELLRERGVAVEEIIIR